MKRTLSILFLTTSLYFSTVQNTHAIFCANCATWVQDLINHATQGLQYTSELSTQYSTGLVAVNDKILKPLKDALTISAIMTSGDNMKNLIVGGLGNEGLLITNPQAYLNRKANTTMRTNLATVANQRGAYSNSILNSVINSRRYSSNNTSLASLSQSSLPSIIQKKICTEDNLDQTARRDVMGKDGTYDPSQFAARKKAIDDAFCIGNPMTDPALAQRLLNANRQNPSIGGGDAFLAMTSGDNEYARSQRAQAEIYRQMLSKIDEEKQALISGGGIRNETACAESAPFDEWGDPVTASTDKATIPCIRESVTRTSASLKTMWDDAIGSPLKTLQNSLTGAGSIVGTAFQTVGLLNGINSAFNTTKSNLGAGDGTSNGGSQTTNSSYSYTNSGSTQPNTPTIINTSYTQDLLQNQNLKNTLVNPIRNTLLADLSAVEGLIPLDQKYISEINLYESKLALLNDCSLASSFYTPKKSSTDALLTQITNELASLPAAITTIKNTLTAVEASNSSTEITNLFNAYKNQVDSKKLPDTITKATREGEYLAHKASLEQDLSPEGTLTTLITRCEEERRQRDRFDEYYH